MIAVRRSNTEVDLNKIVHSLFGCKKFYMICTCYECLFYKLSSLVIANAVFEMYNYERFPISMAITLDLVYVFFRKTCWTASTVLAFWRNKFRQSSTKKQRVLVFPPLPRICVKINKKKKLKWWHKVIEGSHKKI